MIRKSLKIPKGEGEREKEFKSVNYEVGNADERSEKRIDRSKF